MEKQKLIDSFHKNSVDLIKICLQEFRGKLYCDLRLWHLKNPAENGSEGPTHKGICLSAELLPRLIEGLKKAQEIIENAQESAQEGEER